MGEHRHGNNHSHTDHHSPLLYPEGKVQQEEGLLCKHMRKAKAARVLHQRVGSSAFPEYNIYSTILKTGGMR